MGSKVTLLYFCYLMVERTWHINNLTSKDVSNFCLQDSWGVLKVLSLQSDTETALGMQGLSNLITRKPMCYYDL